MNFKDLLLCLLKAIILTAIIMCLGLLGYYDYHLGINYCDLINIPRDLTLTIVSPGMAIEVGIVLFVFEIIGLYFIVKLLRKNKYFDNFCNFLILDYYV